MIRIDAYVGGDVQGALRNVTGGEIGRGDQSTRGGKSVVSAAADGEDAVIRLDDFAVPGNQEEVLAVGHDEKGFELLQHAVATPLLGKFDGCADKIAIAVGEARLEERKGICDRACKSGNDAAVVEAAHFAGGILHDDRIAHGHLSVAGDGGVSILLDREDGGGVK